MDGEFRVAMGSERAARGGWWERPGHRALATSALTSLKSIIVGFLFSLSVFVSAISAFAAVRSILAFPSFSSSSLASLAVNPVLAVVSAVS